MVLETEFGDREVNKIVGLDLQAYVFGRFKRCIDLNTIGLIVSGQPASAYDGSSSYNVKGSITAIVPDREGPGMYEAAEDCTGVATFGPASA